MRRGAEFFGYGEALPGLKLLGGAACIDAELARTAGGGFNGNRPQDVPAWCAVVTAEADTRALLGMLLGLPLYGTVSHTGPWFVDAANTQKVPGFTLLDFGLNYLTLIGT